MKLPFTSHRTQEQVDTTNVLLDKGMELEKKGDLVNAFMLYSGLFAADESCIACRAHMARVATKLERNGKAIVVVDEKNKKNEVLTAAKPF